MGVKTEMNTAENLMKKKMVFKTELDKLTSNSDVLWRRATDRLAEIMTKYGSLPIVGTSQNWAVRN